MIGDRIRTARNAAVPPMSQKSLAAQAGLHVNTVKQLESGQNDDPGLVTLRAVARVLGLTLDELAGGASARSPRRPRRARRISASSST